ncbi:MAG TPA: alpha/beta hydrolase-fold protein [Candidatus Polarisedimenticolaceae bacterium]|nr:alpha/beta hydrolase-fold protein [Candidatus Polarisedimenticolaceae bacterium]
MAQWMEYPREAVTGTLRVLQDVHSPQLDNRRDLLVLLPPSWPEEGRRWPVLYMQDGQNLFDAATSFAGDWGVAETMEELSRKEIEAIVVGIPNTGSQRLDEYSPFHHPGHGGGKGDAYLEFLVSTVKPLVDAAFPTDPAREATGILGSSMGGLISLYALFRRPDVFGLCGAMSPAFWFAHGALLDFVRHTPKVPARIYLDTGTREMPRIRFWRTSRRSSASEMAAILRHKGYVEGTDLRYVVEKEGEHNEGAWRRRLPGALRFLLGPRGPRQTTALARE